MKEELLNQLAILKDAQRIARENGDYQTVFLIAQTIISVSTELTEHGAANR
jgi:hypothetical protein